MAELKEYITYTEEKGSINISAEVVAAISAESAMEVDGVAGLATSLRKDLAERISGKSMGGGVRLHMDGELITIEVFIMVKLGYNISEVAMAVQCGVTSAVEAMTGLKVDAVNVTVSGVAFDKVEKNK